MKIIGHRGARGLAPENTLESIKAALKQSVDMIEIDIRLHDGDVVLSHYPTIQSESYTKLTEILEFVKGSIPLVIEVKESRVCEEAAEALRMYRGPYVISSKRFAVLQKMKELLPGINVAVTEKWSGVRAVAEAALLDTKELHINHNWLWGSFVRSLKHQGFVVYAYTVNTKERAKELREWGVDGIFTDYPNRFSE